MAFHVVSACVFSESWNTFHIFLVIHLITVMGFFKCFVSISFELFLTGF